ncbi:DMT family transporter [Poseidonibacter lekithochrous]|uniref:DMT family transporter n=1 Tax=Poseidonibacter TaxID=2321187 RepID=UPI001C08A1A6|nr:MULTISPECIES: DMT family transporter [Poseidonibacter]MBU3013417.1 DMT family transporter [Poseidonibacter lekithochrous]MDO6826714.1 DMT family transporter [Poseidonibacter sp. 1_MG-2023]
MFNINIKDFLLPISFVFLYGSGFIFTQYGLVNTSPMAFLAIRFFIAFCILLIITSLVKAKWPKTIKEFIHISIAGMLTVGTFSVGVYMSISYGISGSLNSLIIALQPILVSFLAFKFLNETSDGKIWLGLFIGFIGVNIVVISNIDTNIGAITGVTWSFIALFGLSFGNLYQKKYCKKMNLFSGGAIQTLSSTILVLPFLLYEDIRVSWNLEFIVALFYMVVAVSIGALSLLYIMIEKGDVSKVSSIFYLVPVSASIVSYVLFDEAFKLSILIGIITVLIGMLFIHKKTKKGKI